MNFDFMKPDIPTLRAVLEAAKKAYVFNLNGKSWINANVFIREIESLIGEKEI